MPDTPLEVRDLGRADYRPTLASMREAVDERANGQRADQLWLVEHEGVYSAGRRTDASDWTAPGTELIQVERGGRSTWHGPGQVVAYPIVALVGRGRDLHAWLRFLEDVIIATLSDFGLEGERDPDGTGVFVERRKIASIGIAVRRWVSFHGLALNVDPDLGAFAAIRPCGFDALRMTSLARELGHDATPSFDEVKQALARTFARLWLRYPL